MIKFHVNQSILLIARNATQYNMYNRPEMMYFSEICLQNNRLILPIFPLKSRNLSTIHNV